MSSNLSRRKMLSGAAMALAGASILASCKTTTGTGGKTQVIALNVPKIKAYATAGLNAAATINSLLSLIPAYAPYGVTIAAVTTLLSADLGKFSEAVGTANTIVYDSSSTATLVTSIVNDLGRLLTAIGSLSSTETAKSLGLSSTVQNTIETVTSALNTIVSVFQALLGTVVTTGAGPQSMSETEALRVLGAAA